MPILTSDSLTVSKLNDGDPGAPGQVYQQATEPTTKVVNMLWQYTGSSAITASGATIQPSEIYSWTGSTWILWQITAANLNVQTLQALAGSIGHIFNIYSYADPATPTLYTNGSLNIYNEKVISNYAIVDTSNGINPLSYYTYDYTTTGLPGTVPTSGWVNEDTASMGWAWMRKTFIYQDGQKVYCYYPNLDGAVATGVANSDVVSKTYQVSSSGTIIPTGTWLATKPTVSTSQFLWVQNTYSGIKDSNHAPMTVLSYTCYRGGIAHRGGSYSLNNGINVVSIDDIENGNDSWLILGHNYDTSDVSANGFQSISKTDTEVINSVSSYTDPISASIEASTQSPSTYTYSSMTPSTLMVNRKNIIDLIYPVGSYYTSSVSTDPNTLFGIGTWARVKGRVLVGVNETDTYLSTAGLDGGSVNPLTSHTHTLNGHVFRWGETGKPNEVYDINSNVAAGSPSINSLMTQNDGTTNTTNGTGDNTSHNNWQPYESAYIWKRTA